MKALKIKTVRDNADVMQVLYRCDPPIDGNEFVVSSASCIPTPFQGCPETYVFESNSDGVVSNWSELSPSQRGFFDCDRVLTEAGYEIVSDDEPR